MPRSVPSDNLGGSAAEGHFKRVDLVAMTAFGGGMAIDVALYRWP